jgi:hypothetical protein
MSDRFIKFIPSLESDYLQEHHPNAFLLLCHIAKRARRISGHPDGLEIGEAYIGDYRKAGIETEMKYRTAKKVLEQRQHVKIIETCRNCKKSTTRITTKGTLVKLLRSDIWDINSDHINDQDNDRITTRQRPDNDEQERKRMNKNEKEKCIKEKVISIDEGQENQVAVNQDFSGNEIKHNVHYQSFSPLNYSKPSKKKEAVPASPLAAELLAAFNSSLLKNIPEVAGKPASSQDAKHFDKLLKDYSSEEIQSVIDFSHKDNFWSQHVHTPNYLKLKFSKLLAASRRKKKEILPLKDSIRDEIKERFKHGQEYNGAECYINEDSIAFTRGMTHHQIRFTEKGFWDQFNNILRKLGINENGF